jgi:hypothetical protein
MLNSPVIAGLLAFSLAACLFAFIKGGMAERIGAGVILANLIITVANEYLFQNQVMGLAIDGLTAFALLALAVRYASLWLGCVMLLYALQFTLHAFYLVSERPRDMLHVVVNNVDFFTISLCLVIGTAVAWRRSLRPPTAH